jgi:arabinan endo-1,5-alpha-L-arabinosidase
MSRLPSPFRSWPRGPLAGLIVAVGLFAACGGDDGDVADDETGGRSQAGAAGRGGGAAGSPGTSGSGGSSSAGHAGQTAGAAGAVGGSGGSAGSSSAGSAGATAGGTGGSEAGAGAAGEAGVGGEAGNGASGNPGTGGKAGAGSGGKAGSGGSPPEPVPCTTKITYGSRWIHPDGHPGYDVAQGNITWDGTCTPDGANSYATLSNGWKPYFQGHSCTMAFERTGCAGAPTSCRTRVSYGPAWLAAPNHPAKYDDVGGRVSWSGECVTSGSNSSGQLSNGWGPTFSGKNNCQLSFSYQECGGLYTNPVIGTDCPDPGVVRAGNQYVLTSTGGDGGGTYVIRTSKDLVSWAKTSHVFPSGKGPKWSDGSYWAPEIHPVPSGDFVAYFSAHEKGKTLAVGAAKGKSVTGPFTDLGGPLVRASVGAIDVNQFADANGNLYLVWKDDGNSQGKSTPIHGQKLAADGVTLQGSPTTLITNTLGWEGPLVEGPWIIQHGGMYYLFYSANAYYNGKYAVGVARSKNPLGPYEKKGAPILTTNSRWVGPGHCSVVETPAGRTMMVYHAWRAGQVNTSGSGRVVLVDEVVWNNGWPEVPGGPSFESLPMP